MAAEGPWTHHSIGISSRLAALLKTWPADASLGTVVMDFPGYPEMQMCPAIIAPATWPADRSRWAWGVRGLCAQLAMRSLALADQEFDGIPRGVRTQGRVGNDASQS
jgi:hypothetical protein